MRERLKSGALQGMYSRVRELKRRLRHEPLADHIVLPQVPLLLEELRAYIPLRPDESRLYFSLGLAFLEDTQASVLSKAFACLRCAETLNFPSPERLGLYKALCASRQGHRDAGAQITHLQPYELTAEEKQVREEILAGSASASAVTMDSVWRSLSEEAEKSRAASLLVMGDAEAFSAAWLPQARYLLVDEGVTGLTPEAVVQVAKEFELGIASAPGRERLERAGVSCGRWLALDKSSEVVVI